MNLPQNDGAQSPSSADPTGNTGGKESARVSLYSRYGEDLANFEYGRPERTSKSEREIHGDFNLPEGYELVMLPKHAFRSFL